MLRYYFSLGFHSLKRNPALTLLLILTLAVGIGASMSTLTILHMMSHDPIPHKSSRLLVPIIDTSSLDGYVPGERTEHQMMTYQDTINLLNLGIGHDRAAFFNLSTAIVSTDPNMGLIETSGMATTNSFFHMFEVPFKYGAPWSKQDETNNAKVTVLSLDASEKYFGNTNPVGKTIRLHRDDFTIVGVLDQWNPLPHYYNLINDDGFNSHDDFYVPFSTATSQEVGFSGSVSCNWAASKPGTKGLVESTCNWIQFWIEAESEQQVSEIKNQLDAYVSDQRKLGRIPRHEANELLNVMEWMQYLKFVDNDEQIATWLSFGFLALCLVNAIGLLLAKFSAFAPEIGVRRALGASKSDIFLQFLIETVVLGLIGGAVGLLFSFGGLWIISTQTQRMSTIAHMDVQMLVTTFIIAIGSAVIAGLLPTWRACQVTPAIQLKTQ